MEITEKQLIEIISEEIEKMIQDSEIDDGVLDRLKAQGSGALAKVNPFADKADQGLRQAASLMKSYDQQLLKLAQSLETDAEKLGIGDKVANVQQAINRTRATVKQMAKAAPKSARDVAADQQRATARAAQQGQGTQSQTQQRSAPAPAAAPAAAPAPAPAAQPAAAPAPAAQPAPAAAPAAQPAASGGSGGGRQLSQDPRNVRRRARRAAQRAAADKERARKDRRNAQARARRAARRQAAQTSAPANESKVNKGETLNEQLQKISERWGFGK